MKVSIVSMLLVLCLVSFSVGEIIVNKKERDVPASLTDRREYLVLRQNTEAIRFNEETYKYFDKKETEELLLKNILVIYKLDGAFYEIELCQKTGQGYYCEQAERDLNEAEYEEEKIKEANDKAGHKI